MLSTWCHPSTWCQTVLVCQNCPCLVAAAGCPSQTPLCACVVCVLPVSVCGNNACELGETCVTVGCAEGCARDCGRWGVTIPCPQPSLESGYPALPCANRGVCEPRTGSCACYVGYTGPGCTLCDRLYEARTVFGLHLCVRSPPATCQVCGVWCVAGRAIRVS